METLSIDDINRLQQEHELISKQYNSLLKQYNTVLKLAKENADSNEFCISELEEKYDIAIETLKKIGFTPNWEFINWKQRGDSMRYWAKKTLKKLEVNNDTRDE